MHVHTSDSPDADIPAWQLARRGYESNLSAIGFVAHVDLDPEDYCYGGFSAQNYDESINRAKAESEGRLLIMKGLEVGEPHLYEEQVKNLVDYSDYDFITGALHSVSGEGMILGAEAYAGGNPLDIVEQYFLETLLLVSTSDIDILAHLGLFRRGLALAGLDYTFDETKLWPETVRKILETMIDRNIALELNTAGLRRIENTTYPTPQILEMFWEMGGRMVTIGSDSHREPHIFFGLDKGRELLLEKGFTTTLTFNRRVPVEFSLV